MRTEAAGNARPKEKRMRAKVERVLDEVDATDSQQATIEAEADNAIARGWSSKYFLSGAI